MKFKGFLNSFVLIFIIVSLFFSSMLSINLTVPNKARATANEVCDIAVNAAFAVENSNYIRITWKYTPNPVEFKPTYRVVMGIIENYKPQPENEITHKPNPFSFIKPDVISEYIVSVLNEDGIAICTSNRITFTPSSTGGKISGSVDLGKGKGTGICEGRHPETLNYDIVPGENNTSTFIFAWNNIFTADTSPPLTNTTSGRVYIDNNGPVTATYKEKVDQFRYEVILSSNADHKFWATQTFTDSDTKAQCESDPSETLQYSASTKKITGGIDTVLAGAGTELSKINDETECEKHCPSGVIRNAFCQAQCALIDWLSQFVAWVINHVLFPALGFCPSGKVPTPDKGCEDSENKGAI